VPGYLRTNQLPSYQTNCIDDWETKVETVVDETLNERMTLISGIPSWVQMYFDKIKERTGKPVKEVFPDFSLFVYGGVNFEPYRAKMEATIGKKIDSIELVSSFGRLLCLSGHADRKRHAAHSECRHFLRVRSCG
jgi:hypothetical protein